MGNHEHNNFCGNASGFSAERLVEFGIGMSLANQFTRMMNQTMSETMQQWPSTMNAPGGVAPSRLYYVMLEGKQAGPFSETEIARLINDKKIVKETYVWHQGMKEWKPAQDVPEILRIIALAPPPFEGA
ncbi:hypothetical protein AGMMS50267_10800 [Spirochaetia bacterium]|nr:hypothetical protein AGMMS50267_10800 [Spirochaetia bacterium]